MSLALTFPGGKLLTITVAATAGNVVTNKTPGTRKRWVLLYGRITVVCDGNASDRRMDFLLTDGTNILDGGVRNNTAWTAGQTRSASFNRWGGTGIDQSTNDHARYVWSGIIEGADQLRLSLNGGLAGDSYSGYIRVLELGL